MTQQPKEEPLERIVWQFKQFEFPDRARTELAPQAVLAPKRPSEFDELIEWRQCELEQRRAQEELSEMEVDHWIDTMQQDRQRDETLLLLQYYEYTLATREEAAAVVHPDPALAMEVELRTIQTLQIVCGDNTIYCQ